MRQLDLYRLMAGIALLLAVAACSGPENRPGADESSGPAMAGHVGPEGKAEHEDGVVELTPEAAARIEIRTAPVEERVLAAKLETTGQVDFDQTRLAHVSPRISGR